MIITFGGWGEKKYAKFYKKLASQRIKRVEVFLVKRKRVLNENSKVIEEILGWVNGIRSSS